MSLNNDETIINNYIEKSLNRLSLDNSELRKIF